MKNTKNKAIKSDKVENGYFKYNHIKQITLSGMLVAFAIIIGFFGFFPLAGGHVYLLAAVVFLFPLILKMPYVILSTIASVLVVDGMTGYIAFTWITLIAYVGANTIISLFKLSKFKLLYLIYVIVASAYLIIVFLLFESIIFGKAYAIKDAVATTIQMSIVIPIVFILYWPINVIVKAKLS